MLPMKTTGKVVIQPEAQHEHNDKASMADRINYEANVSALPKLSDRERSHTHQRGTSHNQPKPIGIERKSSTNVERRAPRASGIVAPHSNYYRASSKNNSQPSLPLVQRAADTIKVERPRPASEVLSAEGRTSRGHARPISLQQHFTPRKIPKAPTASFFAQPTAKQHHEDVSPSDIARLQTELAQLHLLHRDSAVVQIQRQKSAESVLQRRFEDLSERHVELKNIACESQALINQSALLAWCQCLSDIEIAQKVQILSHCITEVSLMLGSESQIPRLLGLFQAWSDRVGLIQKSRRYSTSGVGQTLDFVESVGDRWSADIDLLTEKLSSLSRKVESLGAVREESSLSRVLLLLHSIITNLKDELELIRSIEHEIMAQEINWVQDLIQDLAGQVDTDDVARAISPKGTSHVDS